MTTKLLYFILFKKILRYVCLKNLIKIMKKNYLTLFVVLLTAIFNSLNAQKFYVNASMGFGIPIASTNSGMFGNGNITLDQNDVYTYQAHSVSLASGKNYEFLIGYKFSPNIGIELGYSQIKGDHHSVHWVLYDQISNSDVSTNTWRISPSIVFLIPFNKAELYSKFGPNFGKGVMQNDYHWMNGSQATLNILQETQMNQSIGAHGAVGVNYKVYKNLALNCEMNLSMSSLISQSMEIKNYIEDGQEKVSELSISDKQVVCKDSYVKDSNAIVDPDTPTISTKEYYSFNNISLKLGLRFSF